MLSARQQLNLASRRCFKKQPIHQRFKGIGPFVQIPFSINRLPDTEMNHTVSRRIEPSSRTAFMDEQSNPCDLLQPQDAMSRHRGAERARLYELSEHTSLLSPAYLLSVDP